MKRGLLLKVLAVVFVLPLLVAGCGKRETTAETSATTTKAATTKATTTTSTKAGEGTTVDDTPVEIVVWTCNTGNTGEWLTEAAARFTASQNKYIIKQEYAGSYAESLAKLVATDVSSYPDIFHSDTEGAYTVYYNDWMYTPIQKYIDEDNYDMSAIMANLRNTYTMNGEWQCMPLGNTLAGFFYNAELLERAGIDPLTDLNSYQEIVEACRKLKAIGVEYPWYQHASSGFYSFAITAQGIQYVDNNNGKDGVPTRSLISEGECFEATRDFFQFIKDLKKEDLMLPFGTSVADGRAAFVNEECALMCAFISAFGTVNNAVGGKFEFGFHVAPTITAGKKNVGQCTGGGCLFLANKGEPEKERGAWEFMKFLMEDENVVGYAKVSGYLPITETGFNHPDFQEHVTKNFPTARYAYEAQKTTPESCYNAWLPMFTDFHALCRDYYALAYDDDSLSAEEVTRQFAEAVDEAIRRWHLQQKK